MILKQYVFQHIMHFTLSGAGLSVLIGFIYRYYSLRNELYFFHRKRAILIIGSAIILYPVPTLIPCWVEYRYSEKDSQDWVKEYYPDLLYIFTDLSCSGFYDALCLMLSIIFAVIQIFFIGISISYYAVKCVKLLNAVKHSLTAATYALQKQLLVVLGFQIMIPVFCLILPTIVLFIAMLAGSTDMIRERKIRLLSF